jgi:hypothetical protein
VIARFALQRPIRLEQAVSANVKPERRPAERNRIAHLRAKSLDVLDDVGETGLIKQCSSFRNKIRIPVADAMALTPVGRLRLARKGRMYGIEVGEHVALPLLSGSENAQNLERVGLVEVVAYVIRLRLYIYANNLEPGALIATRSTSSTATDVE